MAISYDGNPYIHSNFFNFTGKAFNNFNFSENNKQPSSVIQDKIQTLQGIKINQNKKRKLFLEDMGLQKNYQKKLTKLGIKIQMIYIYNFVE